MMTTFEQYGVVVQTFGFLLLGAGCLMGWLRGRTTRRGR